jgi:hypothetical protein
MPDPNLPQSVFDAFAAGDEVVTLPSGRWKLSSTLNVMPGTKVINAFGCVLVPSVVQAISISSPIDPVGESYNWIQYHATGEITPGVDTLSLPEPIDFVPGEVVMCRIGVRPVRMVFKEVLACDGLTVQFTEPFDEAILVYGSYEVFLAAAAPDQQTKVGDFGSVTPNTSPGRGYGDDHEIIRFTGIVEDVLITGLTIEWPETYKPNGAGGIMCRFSRNITIRNLRVVNPRGNSVLAFGSSVTIEGLTLEGDGYNYIFNTTPFPALAILGWGGTVTCSDLSVTSTNSILWQFEVGTIAEFSDVIYSSNQPIPGELTTAPFFTAPGSEPVYAVNAVLDIEGAGYLTTWGAPPHIFENSEFVQHLHHPLVYQQFDWVGTVRIGGKLFHPKRTQTWQFTIAPNATYGELFLPEGIYRSGTITVSSTLRNPVVNAVTEVLELVDGVATFPQGRWLDLPVGFPLRSTNFRMLVRVFAQTGADPLTITVEADYLPEENMALLEDLNLAHCWPNEEVSDGTAPVTRSDVIGTSHLTDNNTVASVADGPWGKPAARFVAANSEVLSVAGMASVLSAGGTVAVWFRVDNQGSTPILGRDTVAGREWSIDLVAGRFRFVVWNPAGANIALVNYITGSEVEVDQWHLGFAWHDPVNELIGIQLDDNAVITAARTEGVADSGQPFRVGAVYSVFGNLDIAAIYLSSDVWTPELRAQLYNGGVGVDLFAEPPPGPIDGTARTFLVAFGSAYSGASPGYEVYDSDGIIITEWTTTGFTEVAPGTYRVTIELPDNFVGHVLFRPELISTVSLIKFVEIVHHATAADLDELLLGARMIGADVSIDKVTDPTCYHLVYKIAGTDTEISRKELRDIDGAKINTDKKIPRQLLEVITP